MVKPRKCGTAGDKQGA